MEVTISVSIAYEKISTFDFQVLKGREVLEANPQLDVLAEDQVLLSLTLDDLSFPLPENYYLKVFKGQDEGQDEEQDEGQREFFYNLNEKINMALLIKKTNNLEIEIKDIKMDYTLEVEKLNLENNGLRIKQGSSANLTFKMKGDISDDLEFRVGQAKNNSQAIIVKKTASSGSAGGDEQIEKTTETIEGETFSNFRVMLKSEDTKKMRSYDSYIWNINRVDSSGEDTYIAGGEIKSLVMVQKAE